MVVSMTHHPLESMQVSGSNPISLAVPSIRASNVLVEGIRSQMLPPP